MDLERWIAAQRDGAIRALRRAVSAVDLEHGRPGFGWHVRPAPGSILASPVSAAWDPEPDYFHHWIRDAAVALKVWPDILEVVPESERAWWRQAFRDHVAFSLAISDPDRDLPATNPLESSTRDDHRRFLRPDAELAALRDRALLEEPRWAPDGGPDLERWSRPQDDGPALRAAAVMSVVARCPDLRSAQSDQLVLRDLLHLAEVAGRPSIGPWEEAPARRTTFALLAAWDALDRGATVFRAHEARFSAAARRTAGILDQAGTGEGWRESVEVDWLDSSAVLALLHAAREDGPYALDAVRSVATVRRLEALFARLYPINRDREVPAIGRWADDVFFGGNPWLPVTLGFAEYHYRLAAMTGDAEAIRRGDGYMALVWEVAPEGDDLPEQFDRATGAPVSCRGLTWSAAAFIAAAAARQTVAER
jgi:glucoamylase